MRLQGPAVGRWLRVRRPARRCTGIPAGLRIEGLYSEEAMAGNQGSNQSNRSGTSRRGFAAMGEDEQRQIARKGGQASARSQRRDSQGQFAGSDGSTGSGGRGGGRSGGGRGGSRH
jgi:hypothetical protein